jgi:hypothetical protein
MLNTVQNGKGSKPRPVDTKKYNDNFDSIKWSNSKDKKKPATKKLK